MKPLLPFLLPLLAGLTLVSCSTSEPEEEEVVGIVGLTIREPVSDETWIQVGTNNAQFYLHSKDQRFDEDLIALHVQAVPLMRPVLDEADLLTYIQTSGGPIDGTMVIDDLVGKTVIRYHTEQDRIENPARFRQVLGLQARPADVTYTRTDKGILILHPESDVLALRVGVWRNSYHGRIGEHFERVAADFATAFLVANDMAGVRQLQ